MNPFPSSSTWVVLGQLLGGSSAPQGKGLELCPRNHTGFKRLLQVLSKLCPVWGIPRSHSKDLTVLFILQSSPPGEDKESHFSIVPRWDNDTCPQCLQACSH